MRTLFRTVAFLMILTTVSYTDQPSSKKYSANIDSTLSVLFGKTPPKELNLDQAALLASELANAQCNITFGVKPFSASNYKPILNEGRWQWGFLDVAGINGYSAKVSFDLDGHKPKVEVYFSYDKKSPELIRRPDMK